MNIHGDDDVDDDEEEEKEEDKEDEEDEEDEQDEEDDHDDDDDDDEDGDDDGDDAHPYPFWLKPYNLLNLELQLELASHQHAIRFNQPCFALKSMLPVLHCLRSEQVTWSILKI